MTDVIVPRAASRDWRTIAFRVVAVLVVLLALLLFGGLFSVVAPWGGPGGEPDAMTPEIHRWHSAQWATLMGIFVSGSLLAALRRPRENPALVQFVVLGLIAFFVVPTAVEGFNQEDILFLILVALLVATYPAPRVLRNFAPSQPRSIALLGLTLGAVVLLLPNAWQSLQLQLAGGNEHAELGHWLGSVVLVVWIALAGVLAANRGGGWRALGTITGIALLYLGVAALSVPTHDGSWGTLGGILSILGGVAYIGLTVYETRTAGAEQPSIAARAA